MVESHCSCGISCNIEGGFSSWKKQWIYLTASLLGQYSTRRIFYFVLGEEGRILEHNHGSKTYVLLSLAYWEVLVLRVVSCPICHHGSTFQGAETSHCSCWLRFYFWKVEIEAAISRFSEHIWLVTASPWESCFSDLPFAN